MVAIKEAANMWNPTFPNQRTHWHAGKTSY